jgi:Protein of unknown function with HXXEE motif
MTYKLFLFSLRMFRWSVLAYFAQRGDLSHSLAMQRTAGRSAFSLSMTSTFNSQPHPPSPAVADLESR